MEEKKVCTLEDLKKVFGGEIVDLPGFSAELPVFTVRLRRPSLMAMVKKGKIPNELLVEANSLFTRGASGAMNTNMNNPDAMKNMFEILDALCEASFVEPKYRDMQSAGIELTDEQLLAVFNYTQNGVDALKQFHTDRGSATADNNSNDAQMSYQTV